MVAPHLHGYPDPPPDTDLGVFVMLMAMLFMTTPWALVVISTWQ